MKDKHNSERREFIKGTALSVVLFLLIAATAAGMWWFYAYTEDDGLIYPNVYIFGVDFGGLTPEDAAAKLHELTDTTYSQQNMTVNLPDTALTLTPAQTGASLDVDTLVQLAYGYGREGGRWENTQARKAALLTTHEVDPSGCLTLNEDAIRAALEQAAANAASSLTQPSASVSGEVPDLNLTYEDAAALTNVAHMTLTVVLGTPDRSLNCDALMEQVLAAYRANDFTPIDFAYDVVNPEAPDLESLLTQHTIAPVDAVLDTTDYTVAPEVLGYSFDLEGLKEQIEAAGEGQSVTISFHYTPAALTKAAIESTLFQDVLGSVSTTRSSNANSYNNQKVACKSLNGYLIRPGETFSFNAALGKRTVEKGYVASSAFSGGKNVQDVGGGICLVSSTLYYACLKADLEIVERTCHGFAVSYMPYGMDATVSWGSLDYKFKNNTEYPIRIQSWVADGQVHIKLIGTDTKDYYVKMVYETVDGPHEGKVVYEDFPIDNEEGYQDGDVVQTACTGRTVKTYRVKFSKETDEKISSEYEATSRYKSRDKIIARVPQPTEPPTEPATEPAADN